MVCGHCDKCSLLKAVITGLMIWCVVPTPRCQNENTCYGISRIRSLFNGVYDYVAKGQYTLVKSVANSTHEAEISYLKTCRNSYNCYADDVTKKVYLRGYPNGFNKNSPPYTYTDRGQAEQYCRAEPTCGGLTAMKVKGRTRINWEARRGTELIADENNKILVGSIVKRCPSEERHCLSKGYEKMMISGKTCFSLLGKWPYDGHSFEKAAQYCELDPNCGGIQKCLESRSEKPHYYAMTGNVLKERRNKKYLMAWRKVC